MVNLGNDWDEVAKKREDWKKALAYREKYDLYADSIHKHCQTAELLTANHL